MHPTDLHHKTGKIKTLIPLLFIVSALTLFLAVPGCGDSSTDGGIGNGNGNGELGENEVAMVGQSFSPANLEVEVGTTVTWINQSNEIHTVTSGSGGQHDGNFDSGNVQPDDTYSYEFTEAGTFDYFCQPHVLAGMTGTITVTD